MDKDNLDNIEENLKKKDEAKKKVKISGRSVFKLQEIIKKKAKPKEENSEIIS